MGQDELVKLQARSIQAISNLLYILLIFFKELKSYLNNTPDFQICNTSNFNKTLLNERKN